MRSSRDWIAPLAGVGVVLVFGLSLTFLVFRNRMLEPTDEDRSNVLRVERSAPVYLSAPDGRGFESHTVRVPAEGSLAEQLGALVQRLGENSSRSGAIALAGLHLQVRAAYLLKNGTLILDFEKGVQYNQIDCQAERFALRSLIKTVASISDKIKKVEFLFSGQEAETFAGHINVAYPLSLQDLSGTTTGKGGKE